MQRHGPHQEVNEQHLFPRCGPLSTGPLQSEAEGSRCWSCGLTAFEASLDTVLTLATASAPLTPTDLFLDGNEGREMWPEQRHLSCSCGCFSSPAEELSLEGRGPCSLPTKTPACPGRHSPRLPWAREPGGHKAIRGERAPKLRSSEGAGKPKL